MESLLVPQVLLILVLLDEGSSTVPVTKDLQDKATLSLTDSGPACFDSFITFTASLSFQNDAIQNADNYKYIWKNNVDFLSRFLYENTTYGSQHSIIKKNFSRGKIILFTNFTMRVLVYRQKAGSTDYEEKPFIQKDHVFYLTSPLNGVLMMSQDTGLKRREKYFETNKTISLHMGLTDEFIQKNFTYTWTFAKGKTQITKTPQLQIMYNDTGSQDISVHVEGDVLASSGMRMAKYGDFTSKFVLLDPVKNVSLSNTATANIHPYSTYHTNITCTGSEPFSFCVNVTKPKETTSDVIECTTVSLKKCFWDFSYQANDSGIYKFKIYVQNNVSATTKDIELNVFPEGPGPVPAYLPVLCVLIWCLVVFFVFFTYRMDHERSNIESADFDFYSIQSNSLSLLHSFRDFFVGLFHRDRHQQEDFDSGIIHQEFTDYGSLESSVNSGQI